MFKKYPITIASFVCLICFMASTLAAISANSLEKQMPLSNSQTTNQIVGQKNDPKHNQVKKKTTDVSFEDVLIEGKYHFADEAVTTVEGDKVVDALLNVRADFKDRMRKSASRH